MPKKSAPIRQITIDVEQRHIDKAARLNPGRNLSDVSVDDTTCPIALAAAEKVGLKTWVDNYTVRFGGDIYNKAVFACSAKAQRFVEAFDHGRLVKPITFTLRFQEFDFEPATDD